MDGIFAYIVYSSYFKFDRRKFPKHYETGIRLNFTYLYLYMKKYLGNNITKQWLSELLLTIIDICTGCIEYCGLWWLLNDMIWRTIYNRITLVYNQHIATCRRFNNWIACVIVVTVSCGITFGYLLVK